MHPLGRTFRAAALACLFLLSSSLVRAQETPAEDDQPLWEFKLVPFAQNFPSYPGSRDQNLTVLPLPVPVYHGKFLRFGQDLEDLAEGRLFSNDRYDLSLSVSAQFPADSVDLSGRDGMPDLDFLFEAGPELIVRLRGDEEADRELKLSLQARAAISANGFDTKGRGFVFNPEIEYLARNLWGENNEWRLRVSSTWASSDYADFSYGVAPEFETVDRPAFEARSGYLNTELLFGLNRQITERLEFRGSVRLWLNNGAANRDSPLYQDDINHGIRLALFWTAWQSKAQ